ncbi:IS66 family element, transposase domain protein [Leptospira interrogans str. FPW1039]|uniref:IS66 family element, transposase domain protein n=1 Tax=Leptospira interrogans str. FPW1039 TaxID=1193040 RepID=A0A0F6I7I5_LEPIR|nr:IS66 family element, transposase domain protein [Leptospira interrogans serovar Hebdomadis str. R499]EKR84837.1 IS66 family element, transposase domain protein [Leptospira interrogans str. UI 08452]EMJ34010.1 IS66 family element, transposase domain protein [Leptospira interrogans str. FPW1039]EMN36826.1 IS66 family element, transposase domain protein [Leptospira interrogans serovar Medanensis str. L0448]EMN39654.1 IS66 family element, transposase domain protein [Leptospira interrogans str. L
MNKRISEVAPKSSMGKALSYLAGQWEKLLIFLDRPALQLDTNLVENDIRLFVIGRKNWLFSGCPQGATASAGFYSLIQNANVSGMDSLCVFERSIQILGKGAQDSCLERFTTIQRARISLVAFKRFKITSDVIRNFRKNFEHLVLAVGFWNLHLFFSKHFNW